MDLIFDGDFSTAQPISPLLYSSPIPGVATKYLVTQRFCQQKESFAALAMGVEHTSLSGYFLVEETPLENAGGGIVVWSRIFSKIPETHDEPSTISYDFIGYAGSFGNGVTEITGRGRVTQSVNCRIQHDYFLVGSIAYPTILDVPKIEKYQYRAGDDPRFFVDFLYSESSTLSSDPTLEEYYAMIDAETAIAAEDSSLDRWMGQIVVRKTPYILPR